MSNLNMPDWWCPYDEDVRPEVSSDTPGTVTIRIPLYQFWPEHKRHRFRPTPEYARRLAYQELGLYLAKVMEQLGSSFGIHIKKDCLRTNPDLSCDGPAAHLELEVSFMPLPEP